MLNAPRRMFAAVREDCGEDGRGGEGKERRDGPQPLVKTGGAQRRGLAPGGFML